jgi:hypothetical protein
MLSIPVEYGVDAVLIRQINTSVHRPRDPPEPIARSVSSRTSPDGFGEELGDAPAERFPFDSLESLHVAHHAGIGVDSRSGHDDSILRQSTSAAAL